MSLLAGIAEGLRGAGQTVGRGFFAHAQMLNENEREKIRQKSLETRWAREDARNAIADQRYEERIDKENKRYDERMAIESENRKDTKAYRETQATAQAAREDRQSEKQDATLLGQGLDRLDKMKREKAKEVLEMFKDPMTGTITDQAGYNSAMQALQQSYQDDAAKLVSRSGFSREQVDKYGFGMFLPEDMPEPITEEPTTEIVEGLPAAEAAGFDISSWASKTRTGTDTGTGPATNQPKPLTGMQPKPLSPSEMSSLSPEEQQIRYQEMMDWRKANQGQNKKGLLGVDTAKLGSQLQAVW